MKTQILVLLGQNSDHSVECNGAADLFIADFGVDTYGDLSTSGANALDSRYFQGLIDEVRAYNRVLSQGEMAATMRGNPLLAWNPNPVTGGVVDIRYHEPLGWSAGEQAAEHDVYSGLDPAAVRAATPETADVYKGRQTRTAYDLTEPLQWGRTCYWRVDELNTDKTVTKGNVWSFRVADYLIVDDFESYNDEEDQGTRIYETWIDGWATKDNGSTIGNWDPPFAEQTIVHSGRQSMPMDYNNIKSPFYSQAYRELSPVQDGTGNGVTDLVLWLRGNPVAYLETAPGAFTISASGVDIWGTADEFRYAFQRLSGNGSITGKTWTDMRNADGTVAATAVTMAGSICIGLCVTSHNAAATTTAQFSGAAPTGNVTGPWQVADVGIDHPGNSPQGLYVALEDSTGRAATVANRDPTAALATEWTKWKIPLRDFAGVDLTRIKRLYIGVGEKENPQPDGTGQIFIDNIRLTRPE